MVGNTLDVEGIISPDNLARVISEFYITWDQLRQPKMMEIEELRAYLYATDTKTTTSALTPWKNTTTLPKLTQIMDNLHANYMAGLFPNSEWLIWEADNQKAATSEKRDAVQAYTRTKIRNSGFRETNSQLLLDFIQTGNVFGMLEYVNETITLPDGEEIAGYVGPKLRRISIHDIVFNPTAISFEKSPKIIRSMLTLGELSKQIKNNPEKQYLQEVFDKMMQTRSKLSSIAQGDQHKRKAFRADGFGGIDQYWDSEYVEILDFYGDLYDKDTGELLENHIISIVDRSFIIRQVANPSWFGTAPIYHTGWRQRTDNIYAMGPLDNLVGMQYMIDKLQNSKADILDQIIHPETVVLGEVDEPDSRGPGATWYAGDDGDVKHLTPDATALVNDNQIAQLEAKMEEYAGAPREKMGFRTPGEKTKFEVQVLDNAGSRIFLKSTAHYEETFIEPIVNGMLEMGRRNMDGAEEIRVQGKDLDIELFKKVTKEDITAEGKLRPIGARHFAEKANRVQEIAAVFSQPIIQDPSVKVHFSGKKTAQMIDTLFNLREFELYQPYVGVGEQMELQRMANQAEENLEVEQLGPSPEEINVQDQ